MKKLVKEPFFWHFALSYVWFGIITLNIRLIYELESKYAPEFAIQNFTLKEKSERECQNVKEMWKSCIPLSNTYYWCDL